MALQLEARPKESSLSALEGRRHYQVGTSAGILKQAALEMWYQMWDKFKLKGFLF